jgi:hypothetical protein
LNVALNTYAREHGVLRSVGSISLLNSQSLSLAKRLGKKKIMTVILVHIRGIGRTFRNAIGAPLRTRFSAKVWTWPCADTTWGQRQGVRPQIMTPRPWAPTTGNPFRA